MLKMFSTQLSGMFKRLHEKEEFSIEDGARLLAQAAVGEGKIYIYGDKEMAGVMFEATEGAEPIVQGFAWTDQVSIEKMDIADRVLILSRYSNDTAPVGIGKALREKGIPFVSISTHMDTLEESLQSLADVAIDLKLLKGLLPDDEGNRFGYPSLMAGLFVYYGIKFTIDEIIAEYE
ncbi:DUF2529 domain-containing protein [Cytobacillus spongiae]|uniref:DUF2529 domain-containing protein n=1 Tax=Cytobacillus spongiae TaxID=2901381 RepID=UPI001F300BF2|nr:DUF2529 domain-containing protein [Cytobacillus spongiae]UII55769.1 DUF2529 domain-containing protein [Cytobacillus spongiae]